VDLFDSIDEKEQLVRKEIKKSLFKDEPIYCA